MNVLLMLLVVAHVHDAVKCKASLPNLVSRPEFFANSIGIAAFDKLHRSLQRTASSRSNQQVDMIWHHDKFVERVLALIAIKDKHLNEEQCVARNAKNSRALIRNSVNEESTVKLFHFGVQSEILPSALPILRTDFEWMLLERMSTTGRNTSEAKART